MALAWREIEPGWHPADMLGWVPRRVTRDVWPGAQVAGAERRPIHRLPLVLGMQALRLPASMVRAWWPLAVDAGQAGDAADVAGDAQSAETEHGHGAAGSPAYSSSRAGADDPASYFDALFARCERQVFGCLWRLTGDRALASDLCQETFLRAWQHLAQIRAYDEPLAWLLRVATNLALNVQRRRHTRVGIPLALSEHNAPVQSDPAAQIHERDLVHQTLLGLPLAMRATLVLREVYGLSFEEIAQALGSTPAATKMTLSRARERFRQRYRREEDRA